MIDIASELGKQTPFSLSAEQAVLGCILIKPDSFITLSDIDLLENDFYSEINADVFSAMKKLYNLSKAIDAVTLIDKIMEVRKEKKSEVYVSKEDIEAYIKNLSDSVPSPHNVLDYGKIVKEKSRLRLLLDICGEISDEILSDPSSADDVIELAEERIYALSRDINIHGLVNVSDVVVSVYQRMQSLSQHPEEFTGTQTGFSGLDRIIEGMEPTDLVFIGARPAMGKTSFAMNVATNVAKQTKKKVAIFSLEMSKEQLVERLLSSEAQIDSKKLHKGNLTKDDWNKIADASSFLSDTEIYIDDTPVMSCSKIRAKLRRLDNVGLVLIDYLGLLRSDERRTENRVQELSAITRDLKLLTKEIKAPVIVCAQLNRGAATRASTNESKEPQLSDLRDSGSIEQDADMVIFIHREDYYRDDETKNDGKAKIIVAKNRHGETNKVEMKFIKQFTKFVTIDDTHVET